MTENMIYILDVRYHIGSQIYISDVISYRKSDIHIGSQIYILEVRYTYWNYKKVGNFTLGILTQTVPIVEHICVL